MIRRVAAITLLSLVAVGCNSDDDGNNGGGGGGGGRPTGTAFVFQQFNNTADNTYPVNIETLDLTFPDDPDQFNLLLTD